MDNKASNGFLLVDKPAGITSFDVIRQLRKQTGIRTMGHAGTLDPFATGLIVLGVNKYTRLLKLLDNAEKSYVATLFLGSSTRTGDPEGEITATAPVNVDPDQMKALTAAVLNLQELQPPVFSAIQVDGKRAYAKARAREDFSLPPRPVKIHAFQLLEHTDNRISYSCRVSKGTYIRSLSEWIAGFLGTVGYTESLVRTAIGNVQLRQAEKLAQITSDTIVLHLRSVGDILPELESVTLPEAGLAELRQGRRIIWQGSDNRLVVCLSELLQCQGIGFRKDNYLYPKVNL